MKSAYGEYLDRLEALSTSLVPITDEGRRGLFELWAAAHRDCEDYWSRSGPRDPMLLPGRPRESREDLEAKFGALEPEPARGRPRHRPADGFPRATIERRKRLGKAYPAATAAEVIRRVRLERPSRALRDQLHKEMPSATTTLIGHVLKQMDGKRLSATRRKRWDRAANRLIDDGSVTLAELESRLK